MSTLGTYKLPSGRTVEVEIAPSPRRFDTTNQRDEFTPVGPSSAVQRVIEATLDIRGSVASVVELSDTLMDGLLKGTSRPSEVAIEISLKIGASGNLIIAGGSVEGSIKMNLKYTI